MDNLSSKCENCGCPIPNVPASDGKSPTCFKCRMASYTKKIELKKKLGSDNPPEPINTPKLANNFQLPTIPQVPTVQTKIVHKDLPERMKANLSMAGSICTICRMNLNFGDDLYNCQSCQSSSMHLVCYEKSNTCGNTICKKHVEKRTTIIGLKKVEEVEKTRAENSDASEEMIDCPHCSQKIKRKASKCPYCRADLGVQGGSQSGGNNRNTYYIPRHEPIGKFIFLSIVSWGIYIDMWLYRQFKRQKEKNNIGTYIFWRTIFSIFWVHELFSNLKKEAQENKIVADYNPTLVALVFILLFWVAVLLPEPFVYIWFFTAFPMIIIVQTCNKIYKIERNPPSEDSSFTGLEWFLAVFGTFLYVLAILGAFLIEEPIPIKN